MSIQSEIFQQHAVVTVQIYNRGRCYIRSCVNSGTVSYGDAIVDAGADRIGSDVGINATEKALTAMSGSAAGGIVGSSFQTVVENCLNRGQILLATGIPPIQDYKELSSVSGEERFVFVGSIYGLLMYSPNDEANSFEKSKSLTAHIREA